MVDIYMHKYNKSNILMFIFICIIVTYSFIGCNKKNDGINELNSTDNKNTQIHDDNFMIDYSIEATDYKSVWSFADEYTFKNKLDNGSLWLVSKVNDSGIAYGNTNTNDNGETDFISYNLKTKEYTTIDTNNDELKPLFIKENENYLAWVEQKLDMDKCISQVKLFDKKSKKVITIIQGDTYYNSSDSIALGKDYLLWHEFEKKGNEIIPNIKKYDMKTKEVSNFRENAKSPVICDDFIAYLGPNDKDGIAMYIVDGGNEKKVIDGISIYEIASNKNSILISYEENEKYKLAIWENNTLNTPIIENSMYHFEFLEINDSFVYWSSIMQTMLYDRKLNKAILLDGYDESAKATTSNKYIINSKTIHEEDGGKGNGMSMVDIYVKKFD